MVSVFEPDPRHVQIALHDLGLRLPDELPEEERTKFKSLAQDFPHLMQPVKEAARKMQVAMEGAWKHEDRQMSVGPTLMCSAIFSPTRGTVVVGEGG